MELGVDAGVQYADYNSSVTTISIPAERFRFGYFVAEGIEIEPSIAFAHINPEFGNSLTSMNFAVEVGYNHPFSDEGGSLFFIQGGGGLNYIDAGSTDTQFGIGGATGIKLPVVEKLSARLELGGAYFFESDRRASGWAINFLFGFSFFTK
jgi:hypothetical protein